jgi:hypothetical protein
MELAGLLSSMKVLADLTKSAIDLKNETEIRARIIEIQGALLDAQASTMEALASKAQMEEKIAKLEAKLQEINDWSNEIQRYGLVTPYHDGGKVYALKEEFAKGEEPHFLCTNCLKGDSRRSILNPIKKETGFVRLTCPSCSAIIDTGFRGVSGPKYYETYAEAKST